MRLFIGLILPKEVRDFLFNVQKINHSNLAKIKWVPKKNLHLTLKFLGEVDPSKLDLIISKLNKINFEPFYARVKNMGFFGKGEDVKVIWSGITPLKKIISLQHKVDQELLSVFKFDQSFVPHITLGRVKKIKSDKFISTFSKSKRVESKDFLVEGFCLIQSKVTKDGSNYFILEQFNK